MSGYYIPTGHGQAELVEKRSRFIGQVWRADSEEQARARIEETKKRFHDARHNCWCYLLKNGPTRYSDDGEPQGTAGQPMLNVFQREGVVDAVCVVTRYFGGVLLGAGGLVRAYTQAAKDSLDAAGLSVVRRWTAMRLCCGYPQLEGMRREAEAFGGVVEGVEYGAGVELSLLLPGERAAEFAARVVEVSAGALRPLEEGERFRDAPWRAPAEKR